eukprot:scaffold117985_cov63-Phaeocystis_antarctica.AAC.3
MLYYALYSYYSEDPRLTSALKEPRKPPSVRLSTERGEAAAWGADPSTAACRKRALVLRGACVEKCLLRWRRDVTQAAAAARADTAAAAIQLGSSLCAPQPALLADLRAPVLAPERRGGVAQLLRHSDELLRLDGEAPPHALA